jgi:hypothetical protein
MKSRPLLLPHGFRFPGYIFTIAGSVFGIMRFWFDIKPKFLVMRPYAIYSEYLGEKYMHFIRDNMSEELVGILLVIGAWMIALSRDKEETEENTELRIRAFHISAYAQMVFMVFSLLFTYGIAFIYMLMMYMIIPPVIYFLAFLWLKSRRKTIS